MAPLPPFNTKRWYLNYTVGGEGHTLMMRSADALTPADASFAYDALLDDLSGGLYNWVVTSLEVSDRLSNVRNVVPWTGQLSYGSVVPQPPQDRPNFISFVGRSPGGRRSRIFVYGWSATDDPNYRYIQGENVEVDNAVVQLNSFVSSFQAIDGTHPLWHLYANFGYNAYWQKAIRP